MRTITFILLAGLFSLPSNLLARDVVFSWLPNSDSNLSGYRIHYGTESGNYKVVLDVGNPAVVGGRVHGTITGLSDNAVYYFAATAYGTNEVESEFSNEVRVDPIALPEATFTSRVDAGNSLHVFVDGSSSTGSPTSYSWDFGDGSTATGITANHSYATDGQYTITLRTANRMGIDTISHTMTLSSKSNNRNPIANMTVSPSRGTAPLSVAFSGTQSADEDHDALTYSWTFGDGSASSQGVKTLHTYTDPGTYMATLTVSDGKGGITSTHHTISCVAKTSASPEPAGRPTAIIATVKNAASKDPNAPQLDVILDGSQSSGSAPGSPIVQYAWNLGDGSTASGAQIKYSYRDFGTFLVSLTVTDSLGRQATTKIELRLTEQDQRTVQLLQMYQLLLFNKDK